MLQKVTVLLSTLQRNVSTVLFSQQWTQKENMTNCSVVAETMKLLVNSSYGYQIKDSSRHTVMKLLSDEKTRGVNNSKRFEKLHHVNNSLFEVELAKAQIERIKANNHCRVSHSSKMQNYER